MIPARSLESLAVMEKELTDRVDSLRRRIVQLRDSL